MKFTTDSLKDLVIYMCEEVFQYKDFLNDEDDEYREFYKKNHNKKLWGRIQKGKLKNILPDFDFDSFKYAEQNVATLNGQRILNYGAGFFDYLKQGTVPKFGTYRQINFRSGYEFSCLFNEKTCADLDENCIVRYFVNSHFEDANDNWIVTSPDDSELIAMFIHSD